jgi:hypothetical protein
MTGVELIAAERKRQIEEEGWTARHDDEYKNDQLIEAAMCYVSSKKIRANSLVMSLWPWKKELWKPTPDNRIRELEKAGALIAAEIDRLLRLEDKDGSGKNK